jgi:hypothetical protein
MRVYYQISWQEECKVNNLKQNSQLEWYFSSQMDNAYCSFVTNDGLTVFFICPLQKTLCLPELSVEVGLSLLTDLVMVRWLDSHVTIPASCCLVLFRFGLVFSLQIMLHDW